MTNPLRMGAGLLLWWDREDLLHASDYAILQHYFYAARMVGARCEDAGDDAFGEDAAALVVFLDNLDAVTDFDITALGDGHVLKDPKGSDDYIGKPLGSLVICSG